MAIDWLAASLNALMNARRTGKKEVELCPVSNLLLEVLKIMKQNNYIEDFEVIKGKFKKVKVKLGKLNHCKAIKPRFVVKNKFIEKYVRRYLPSRLFGLLLISTSQGLLTHHEAIQKGLGGVLIAYCY